MSAKEKRSEQRAPVLMRIKLRQTSVETFMAKFATNISRSGMFISTRKPKPIGEEVHFELQLADASPLIAGRGTVRRIQEYDSANPRKPHGMGIEFSELDDASREMIGKIVEHKRTEGIADSTELHAMSQQDNQPAHNDSVDQAAHSGARLGAPVSDLIAQAEHSGTAEIAAKDAELEAMLADSQSGQQAPMTSRVEQAMSRAKNLLNGQSGQEGLEALLAAEGESASSASEDGALDQAQNPDEASAALAAMLGGPALVARAPSQPFVAPVSDQAPAASQSLQEEHADIVDEFDDESTVAEDGIDASTLAEFDDIATNIANQAEVAKQMAAQEFADQPTNINSQADVASQLAAEEFSDQPTNITSQAQVDSMLADEEFSEKSTKVASQSEIDNALAAEEFSEQATAIADQDLAQEFHNHPTVAANQHPVIEAEIAMHMQEAGAQGDFSDDDTRAGEDPLEFEVPEGKTEEFVELSATDLIAEGIDDDLDVDLEHGILGAEPSTDASGLALELDADVLDADGIAAEGLQNPVEQDGIPTGQGLEEFIDVPDEDELEIDIALDSLGAEDEAGSDEKPKKGLLKRMFRGRKP